MQKLRLLLFFLISVSVVFSFAADTNRVILKNTTQDEIVLKIDVSQYDFQRVQTPRGEESVLNAPDTSRIIKRGAPDLTKIVSPLIIPNRGKMKIQILDAEYEELEHIKIAPSKGIIMRTQNPQTVSYKYGKWYKKDRFYPGPLAELDKEYVARDYRGQNAIIYPFQYNPIRQKLRVYTSITVKVSKTGKAGYNEITDTPSVAKRVNSAFRTVYDRHFLNFKDTFNYTPLGDDFGRMLIVCYNDFMDEMAPFVSWKQSIGYTVEMVDYATIGSAAALKTYVADYYNTNGLAYLLLVGDHAQVPTSSTSAGDSDNNYGYIVGNDHYLDIFVGRFSAETGAQVTTQVDRTIYYERDLSSSATWFRNAIGMGSSEGPGHDNEYDYQHIDNILTDLTGYGYTSNSCHQSGGSAAQMTSLINAGAGTIFYCGHGSVSSWYTTSWSYTSTNVNALTNENQLPFIFHVACVVGDFKNNTCYSEVWQRATNNGNPTGSVVNCGSTINQSWIPPMTAQDEMADILVAGTKRTFGGVYANGMFKMIDDHGTDGQNMADTWTCFGDPSVQIRTPGTPNGPSSGPPVAPVANFSANPTTVEQGNTVSFTDTSSNSPTSWSWTFQGGTPATSTAMNPTVTYDTLGTYEVSLTVSNSAGSDTETKTGYITVTQATISYCASQGNDFSMEWIAGVEIGGLNNTSGAAGYTDFTSINTNLTAGANIGVTLTPGFASTTYSEYWTIWIDLNQDGDFADTGEELFTGNGSSTVTGSFTVPTSAAGITTRMRVTMKYNGAATPCETFSYGEVEDYTVTIGTGTVQVPVADFSASATTVTVGNSVNFSDLSTNSPTSWAWTFDGGTPASSTAQNPSVTYNTVGTYSVTLTATNSAGSDAETKTGYITVNDQVIQYCTCTSTNQSYEWIAGVDVGPISNASGATGYSDFTSISGNVTAGSSVSVSLTPGFASGSYTEYWEIFIDLNQDGDFADAGEAVYSGSGSGVVSGSFTLPASATTGATRMRVVMKYGSAHGSACGSFTYGEVEDYVLNIQ